jgi:hypothetical protein
MPLTSGGREEIVSLLLDTLVYFSLHSAQPTTQSDNEVTYTGSARVLAPLSIFSFDANGYAVLTDNLLFPTATGGSAAITHVGLGDALTGAGTLYAYALANGGGTVNIAAGDMPYLIGAAVTIG